MKKILIFLIVGVSLALSSVALARYNNLRAQVYSGDSPQKLSSQKPSFSNPQLFDYRDQDQIIELVKLVEQMNKALKNSRSDRGFIDAETRNPGVRDEERMPTNYSWRVWIKPLGNLVNVNIESERYAELTRGGTKQFRRGSIYSRVRGEIWREGEGVVALKIDIDGDGKADNFLIRFIAKEKPPQNGVVYFVGRVVDGNKKWVHVSAQDFEKEISQQLRSQNKALKK